MSPKCYKCSEDISHTADARATVFWTCLNGCTSLDTRVPYNDSVRRFERTKVEDDGLATAGFFTKPLSPKCRCQRAEINCQLRHTPMDSRSMSPMLPAAVTYF